MPETDERIFGEVWNIYNNYRWRELKQDDFVKLSNELAALAELHKGNPLAMNLALALFDTFNELYRNGAKPKIPDYFGRSDL